MLKINIQSENFETTSGKVTRNPPKQAPTNKSTQRTPQMAIYPTVFLLQPVKPKLCMPNQKKPNC